MVSMFIIDISCQRPVRTIAMACGMALAMAGASLGAVAMLGGCSALALAGRRARRGSSRAATARAAEGPVLTLGTRGSPLALAQAYEAKRRLGEARPRDTLGWLFAELGVLCDTEIRFAL